MWLKVWKSSGALRRKKNYNAGLVIFRQGGVHPLEDENGFLRYAVDGDPRRIVRVGATTS